MAVSGTNVFVTGAFYGGDTDSVEDGYPWAMTIAQFSTSGQYIPTAELLITNNVAFGLTEPANSAYVAAGPNGSVYVTGDFDTLQTNYLELAASGYPQSPDPNDSLSANGVAEWNGTSWSALGSGLQGGYSPPSGSAIAADAGTVYVEAIPGSPGIGSFTGAGGNSCLNGAFVRWITGPVINLVYYSPSHTLAWSWDGPAPAYWYLKSEDSCGGITYTTLVASVTSISTVGLLEHGRLKGLMPVTILLPLGVIPRLLMIGPRAISL